MKPTDGGRICGKCEKKIFDFSGMSWAEIMRVQAQHQYAACGMYSEKQLKYWGGEVPKRSSVRWMRAAVLATAMALGTAGMGQTVANPNGSNGIMLRGTVLGIENGPKEPLLGARVLVEGTDRGAITDLDGNFQLFIPITGDYIPQPILVISYVGMVDQRIEMAPYLPKDPAEPAKPIEVILEPEGEIIVFYISEPKRRDLRRMRREEKKQNEG